MGVDDATNLDRATVRDFGREWQRFGQAIVDGAELSRLFQEYFAIFPWHSLPELPSVSMPAAAAAAGPRSWRRASATSIASMPVRRPWRSHETNSPLIPT